ncbi:MAG: class II fructose-bisphosphate aldolase [Candidatus Omnitrophica bacterium]|nr:class II fructose-bisphosphate aldolase [Candidatus Omnitrophota bacterium]MCM8791075.1 class II fructose-bisphosphate aldolase [Candidatus Omnitrophota bacterium]
MGRVNIDKLILGLIMNDDLDQKKKLSKKIVDMAYKRGIYPASINGFYLARGKGLTPTNFTVPAINLRVMTYDLARAIFRVAKKINAGAFIFEIAKSEMGYTNQPPAEYTAVILAAAIKEGWSGPVFIQGDHFQINHKNFEQDPEKELDSIKQLILQAMAAHFYNIDIDSSTVVDLSKSDVKKQQKNNYECCAKLTNFIRQNQPRGIEVSVGGEIGEVGSKNSTVEDLEAFMSGYNEKLRKGRVGISKISVQTGTSHGGVVLPDGSIAKVKLDFETLRALSKEAREKYGMAGAVQHGASTLPADAFGKFPEVGTAEVHLATEFQNMVYDSPHFPRELKSRIYEWLRTNAAGERKPDQTEEQFFYSSRKKALGPFKKEIMALPQPIRDAITKDIEAKFEFLFDKLNVKNTRELVLKYTTLKRVIHRRHKEHGEVDMSGEGAD